jgi:hypothetical protein
LQLQSLLIINHFFETSNKITKKEEIGNIISHKTRNLSDTKIESINVDKHINRKERKL